ncbi:hypothetical protein U14_00789 [Candidatus Moduliflexus flocculans]|uniref:Uncharacterized protein n=1 Tax=Candidatus Moduliflexus flocculans TaxID=1499966 RepID=A0A0S6VXL8_9BACT|nr:hypothetical protein U14_00789 [Candidatus Moduliflexus flocculans]
MLLLAYQSILASRSHDMKQEYAQQQEAASVLSPVKRLSAVVTHISEGFAEYWRVPANDSLVMAEMNLFPKRIML